jgi:hypothetical protein
MSAFPAYASAFEVYPKEGEAFEHLSPFLIGLKRVDFTLRVDDPSVNQGQMVSDFDAALEKALLEAGAQSSAFRLPLELPQQHDFAVTYRGWTFAVEVEKTNREKILRDLLKCHMYLHSGVDFAVIALPKNYPHRLGIWDLFQFGVDRFRECRTYGFGTTENLGRILLLGFNQYRASDNRALCQITRQEMRNQAAAPAGV